MYTPNEPPHMRSRRTQNHTEETGGGGLEPAAANHEHWDLVPHTQTFKRTGVVAG